MVPVDVAIIAVMGLALTYEAVMLKLGRMRLLDPRLPALAGEALEVLARKKSAFKGLYLSLQLSCIAIASAWPFLVPVSAFRERGWLLPVLLLWPVLTYIIADLYVFKLTRGLQRLRPSSCVEFLAAAAVGFAIGMIGLGVGWPTWAHAIAASAVGICYLALVAKSELAGPDKLLKELKSGLQLTVKAGSYFPSDVKRLTSRSSMTLLLEFFIRRRATSPENAIPEEEARRKLASLLQVSRVLADDLVSNMLRSGLLRRTHDGLVFLNLELALKLERAAVGTARLMAIYLGASLVALAFFLALKVSLLAALACGAVAFLLSGLLLRASGRARVISEALRRAGLRPRSRR